MTKRECGAAREPGIWFRPHRLGVGFVPVAWPGWLVTAGYAGMAIGLDALWRAHHRGAGIALIAILTIGYIVLAAHHTDGGLRWRWGDEA